jgi:hypothetical protein
MSAARQPKPKATTTPKRHLRAVPPIPKLTAAQARQHAAIEAKITAAKKVLDDLTAERDKLRDRDRRKLPSREEIVVGGILLKRTAYTYDTFSLKDYKTAGNKVTAAMRKHISPQAGEKWTVKATK